MKIMILSNYIYVLYICGGPGSLLFHQSTSIYFANEHEFSLELNSFEMFVAFVALVRRRGLVVSSPTAPEEIGAYSSIDMGTVV
jgi:hypothetical protein